MPRSNAAQPMPLGKLGKGKSGNLADAAARAASENTDHEDFTSVHLPDGKEVRIETRYFRYGSVCAPLRVCGGEVKYPLV